MASGASGVAEPARSALSWHFLVIAACIGLALSWSWLHFAQSLVDTVQVASIEVLASVYYGLVYLPLALLTLVLCHACRVKARWRGSRPARWILTGLGAGIFGLVFSFGLARLNGGASQAAGAMPSTGVLLALGVALTLVQVGAEEFLFRGWLRLSLRSAFGMPVATVLSALVYAGFILAGNTFAFLAFANLVLFGIFFNLIAERSGGIAAPVAAHFGWSCIEDLGLGLNPNPGQGPFGTVMDFDLLGAPLWGGTEAGLAASIGTSAVLIALILPLLPLAGRSRAAAA